MTTPEIVGMVLGGGLLGSVIGVGAAWGMLRRTVDEHDRELQRHDVCLERIHAELATINTHLAATSRDVAWLVDAFKRNGGSLR